MLIDIKNISAALLENCLGLFDKKLNRNKLDIKGYKQTGLKIIQKKDDKNIAQLSVDTPSNSRYFLGEVRTARINIVLHLAPTCLFFS